MLKSFFEILFPRSCVVCRKLGAYLCSECEGKLEFSPKILKGKNLDRLISCFEYSTKAKRLITAFKFKYIESLGDILAKYLVRAWVEESDSNRFVTGEFRDEKVIVSEIPLHKKRFNERGFNQSELLGEKFCLETGLEYQTLLERIQYDLPQSKLNRKERLKHLAGHFCFIGKIIPRQVLLIDDVTTTGSTLEECAKVLKSAGVKQVSALVLARA